MRNLISFLICSAALLLFSSCREEIIEPGNFAGNYNSPVEENKSNYYSIIINAKDLSSNFQSFMDFSFVSNKALLNIDDVTAGSVAIVIRDQNGVSLYSSVNQTEITNDSRKLVNSIPQKVEIYFTNFSGKLKFSLSYSYE
jgi:hypothetical protein